MFVSKYGPSSGPPAVDSLQQFIAKVNSEHNLTAAADIVDCQLAVAIATPLMKRASELLRQSGELVFIDATGNVDRANCKIFLIMTHCVAGGIPLGCLITTSETKNTIKVALQLYLSLLSGKAFHGEGYPAVFMTDDSDAERGALREVFPSAVILLCSFHVLQAAWRWLWNGVNKVPKEHRSELYLLLKNMLYASSEDELSHNFHDLEVNATAQMHQNFLDYACNMYRRREEWALCFRTDLPVRNNNTNNYVEAAMRVLKDRILHRTKAYNIVQLADFVTTNMELFYKKCLINVANSRGRKTKHSVNSQSTSIPKKNIDCIDGRATYHVKSQTKDNVSYSVDMDLGLCTCFMGKNGGPCKHQSAIVQHFGLGSDFLEPVTSTQRQQIFFLATGSNMEVEWFDGLHGQSTRPFLHNSTSPSTSAELSGDTCSPTSSEPSDCISPTSSEPSDHITPPSSLEPTGESYHEISASTSTDIDTRVSPGTSSTASSSASLHHIFQDLQQKLLHDPDTFKPSVDAFIKNYENIGTDSGLISALFTFGKYSGLSHKGKTFGGKRIGIQPTAIARRKSKAFGRSISLAGRPSKRTFVGEHQYSCSKRKSTEILAAVLPKHHRVHSLSTAVSRGESLGKTTCKK